LKQDTELSTAPRALLLVSTEQGYGGAERNLELLVRHLPAGIRVGVLAQSRRHIDELTAIQRPGLQIRTLDEDCKPADTRALHALLGLYRALRPDAVLVNTRPGARLMREAVRWIPEISQQTFLYVHDLSWQETLEGLLVNLPGASLLVPTREMLQHLPTLAPDAMPRGPHFVHTAPYLSPPVVGESAITELLALLAPATSSTPVDAPLRELAGGPDESRVVLDMTLSLRRGHRAPAGVVRVEREVWEVLQAAPDFELDFCRWDPREERLRALSVAEREWVDTGTLPAQNTHWRPQAWDVAVTAALGQAWMTLPVAHNRPPALITRMLTWRGVARRDRLLAARAATRPPAAKGRHVRVFAANPWTVIPAETLARFKQEGAALVMVLHDVLTWEKPHLTAGREVTGFVTGMLQTLCLADHLIAVSRYSLSAFHDACREHGLVPPPASVCNPSVPTALLPGADAHPPAGLAEGEAFVLLCATLEVRKNHFLLLNLWERLLARLGAQRIPRLIFVGDWGWGCDHLKLWLARDWHLAGHVLHLPQLDDAGLAYLYRHALFTLFPSFAEGYGMPVAESLAAGTPVVTANHPALLEASQGLMPALDPLDLPAWERTVVDLLENPTALAALRSRAGDCQMQAPGSMGAEIARVARGLLAQDRSQPA